MIYLINDVTMLNIANGMVSRSGVVWKVMETLEGQGGLRTQSLISRSYKVVEEKQLLRVAL